MSSPLAIAGVTAVLRDLLNNGLIDHNIAGAIGANVNVTASPPDVIKIDGANAQTQLNLFLHQVTPNPGWRNIGFPARDERGARLTNVPLALDLHYLLTAYGAEDLHSEILLGYAMHLLHETPVLDRQAIRTALAGGMVDGSVLPPAFQTLDAADIADQVEQIKIAPSSLGAEEMSRLWAALQAHYRPTAAYQVSVVLIDAQRPTRASLPVLTRGGRDPLTQQERGIVAEASLLPPYPTLRGIELPNGQIAARLGDALTLSGHHLDGANVSVRFEHPRLSDAIDIPVGTNTQTDEVAVSLPNDAQAQMDWPAGAWSVSLALRRPGESQMRTSNAVPLLLAPRLDLAPASTSATRDAGTGAVTIHLAYSPQARPGQKLSLNCGGFETPAPDFAASSAALDFVFAQLDAGQQWLRLRIDGVDSLLVDRSTTPPRFDATQRLEIPA